MIPPIVRRNPQKKATACGIRPDRKSVSPLVATVLLIVTTLLAGGLLVEGLGRLGAPPMPPQTVVQLWTNYPGYGGVAIIHASGEGITKAYRADIFEETPLGTLLENIRWQNIELRVNGVRMENEIDLALVTGPVKKGMNDLPGPGEALVLSFKGENLKVGDKVELIYTPTGYKMAEATVPEPTPGRAYVDTAIQLRAARMLGRQEATVEAMKKKNFQEARRLAYELQAMARDLHDNYLARSRYLENNLWELHRYMPDLVPENLCKTLIVIYEGCLPYLINALELIETIMYQDLHADDPSLLQAVTQNQITAAAAHSRAILENLSKVENLRAASKYCLDNERGNSNAEKIARMSILTAIPGGFVQDLSRDLYIPFLTPWVNTSTMKINGGFYLELYIYNLGTTRVENLTPYLYMWVDNVRSSGGEDTGDAAFWASRYLNQGADLGNGFSAVTIDPQFQSNPIQPTANPVNMKMWEHIIWNYGWPRLPYPTKCEGQYWWVEEHQLTEKFKAWGLTYDLNENNHPLIEYFRRYTKLRAPYTGEEGRATYLGDVMHPNSTSHITCTYDNGTSWQTNNPVFSLDPGGRYVKIVYNISCAADLLWSRGGFVTGASCGLDIDAMHQAIDLYLVGDDAFWGRKTELSAFSDMWVNALC